MVKPGRLIWLLILLLTGFVGRAQIFIDGNFDDWRAVPPLVVDPVGDVPAGNIDFRTLKIFDTEEFIFSSSRQEKKSIYRIIKISNC
ncbi:MAG: hypothetical protein R2784_03020 [Saprospiraceae bacterium]